MYSHVASVFIALSLLAFPGCDFMPVAGPVSEEQKQKAIAEIETDIPAVTPTKVDAFPVTVKIESKQFSLKGWLQPVGQECDKEIQDKMLPKDLIEQKGYQELAVCEYGNSRCFNAEISEAKRLCYFSSGSVDVKNKNGTRSVNEKSSLKYVDFRAPK